MSGRPFLAGTDILQRAGRLFINLFVEPDRRQILIEVMAWADLPPFNSTL
jgi:hypothetical protein